MKNQEGYQDPTAGKAIHGAEKMPKHIEEVYDALNTIASLHGLRIVEIIDKKTKKRWRK